VGLIRRESTDPFIQAPAWVREIRDHLLMSLHAGETKSIPQLISGYGFSQTTIERAWRSISGETMRDFLRHHRCQIALDRLRTGRLGIDGIAASLGLANSRCLMRLLKHHLGGELAAAMAIGSPSGQRTRHPHHARSP